MQTNTHLRRANADKFFPCQRIAARSRNGAVDALESGDVGAIAFRYLNNRYQQRYFRRTAVIAGLVPVLGWAHSGVNIHNTLRCRDSKRACKAALLRALPKPVFERISQERHAYGHYLKTLREAGIDTTEAKRLRLSHGRPPSEPPGAGWS